jgi:hypothetical protein
MAKNKTMKPQQSSWSGNKSSDISEKIRKKAYELFEKRGYKHGSDMADWLEAEKIVKYGKH